jgi:hypothetical protein
MTDLKPTRRLVIVAVFAAAMAWVESAVVYYLRTMIDRIDPYQPNPLPIIGGLGPVEMVREAATMVMLLTVGILAGRTWRARFGYAAMAFGVWDIFYYVFLKVMCGWPHSLLDWDILFLLPIPWWGPILAPMLIALLMIVWGVLICLKENSPDEFRFGVRAWAFNLCGVVLALYVFMSDALRVANQGADALRNVLPAHFNWLLFATALCAMAAPIIQIIRPRGSRRCRSESIPLAGSAVAEM